MTKSQYFSRQGFHFLPFFLSQPFLKEIQVFVDECGEAGIELFHATQVGFGALHFPYEA